MLEQSFPARPGARESDRVPTERHRLLEARLLGHDAFPADDRVVVELPEQKALSVVVYSNEPDLLRPDTPAIRIWHAVFRGVAQYSPLGRRPGHPRPLSSGLSARGGFDLDRSSCGRFSDCPFAKP